VFIQIWKIGKKAASIYANRPKALDDPLGIRIGCCGGP
jgi:hypothetical protein